MGWGGRLIPRQGHGRATCLCRRLHGAGLAADTLQQAIVLIIIILRMIVFILVVTLGVVAVRSLGPGHDDSVLDGPDEGVSPSCNRFYICAYARACVFHGRCPCALASLAARTCTVLRVCASAAGLPYLCFHRGTAEH